MRINFYCSKPLDCGLLLPQPKETNTRLVTINQEGPFDSLCFFPSSDHCHLTLGKVLHPVT